MVLLPQPDLLLEGGRDGGGAVVFREEDEGALRTAGAAHCDQARHERVDVSPGALLGRRPSGAAAAGVVPGLARAGAQHDQLAPQRAALPDPVAPQRDRQRDRERRVRARPERLDERRKLALPGRVRPRDALRRVQHPVPQVPQPHLGAGGVGLVTGGLGEVLLGSPLR